MKRVWQFLGVIVIVLVIDFMFFMVWKSSGQTPPDTFHFGALTEWFISFGK